MQLPLITRLLGAKLRPMIRLFSAIIIVLFAVNCSSPEQNKEENVTLSEEEIMEKAKGIHERVITLDTHCDINTANFTAETNYSQDLDTQVTLPKMEEGGLDVAWFIVYTGQGDNNEEGFDAWILLKGVKYQP